MLDSQKLNKIFREAETVDKATHAEMRSNVLLAAGDHYRKRQHKGDFREGGKKEFDTKLRITKNHISKAQRRYVNSILMYSGDARASPQNDEEDQDRKAAELNDAVLSDIKRYIKFKRRRRRWARDFFTVGEVCSITLWNPNAGEIRGYEQMVDEFGEPVFTIEQDEMGYPVEVPVEDKSKPIYKGQFKIRDFYGFNLYRAPSAKTMEDSPYLIHAELHETSDLKRKYAGNEEALKAIQGDADTRDYVEFRTTTGAFSKSEGKTLVKEMYIRPGEWVEDTYYPRGGYQIFTTGGELESGELPFGIWPIAHAVADEFTSDARGRSPIKQVKPIQAELNRANSQMALHQVTVGDDKILYMNGTKLAPGALLPGVRGITYAGAEPKILPGRDGSQYLPYLQMNKDELYELLDVHSIEMGKDDKGGYDVYSLLYKEANQKQAISSYSDAFQDFITDLFTIVLELAKEYLPDDALILAAGRKEIVNIAEFRSTTSLHYQVKVEPQDDTIETKFGRQRTMEHILQYSGNNMGREDIGMLIKNMPFANVKHQFRKLTIDEDAIDNEILAIERGENPEVHPEMNHDYAIKRLSMRMNEADFRFLNPTVQQLYQQKRAEHGQFKQAQLESELALKNEFIPVDGPLVGADVYVNDPQKPEKAPKRVRLPQRAVEWLINQLNQQGASLDKLEDMNGAAIQELAASYFGQGGAPSQGAPNGLVQPRPSTEGMQ